MRGALQQLVYRHKIKDTDHLKQVLNSCWDRSSQELINESMLLLTRGLNDCCWSFILRVDTLSIVFVSSLMFACCKPFFWHDNIENVAGLDISQLLLLPAAIQRIFNYNIQILAFFVFPVNL